MLLNLKSILVIVFILLIASCTTTEPDDEPKDEVGKFLGTWNVSDQPARLNYVVTIERSPTVTDQVLLGNFADLGDDVVGLVVNNTIVIDQQDIAGGFKTDGSGNYIDENKLEFEFFLDDGIDKELRQAVFTK